MEVQGPRLIIRQTQVKFGIILYARFRDNLLFFLHPNFPEIRHLIGILKSSRPWTGEVEEASSVSVQFLDANIWIDVAHRKFQWSPHLKESSLTCCLSILSAHPTRVHESWLNAYLSRLWRRSSVLAWYLDYRQEVMSRLRRVGVDPSIISSLLDTSHRTYKTCTWPKGSVTLNNKLAAYHTWLVLPYHPAWARELNAAVRRFSVMHAQHEIAGISHSFGVAWDLTTISMSQAVAKF